LTFCQLFPAALGTRVAGLVLVHTTYTNPVRTTKLAGLTTALERPVIVLLTPAKHMGLIEHNERFAELVRALAVDCFQTTRPRQPMERTV
jgi:hypothetical protein